MNRVRGSRARLAGLVFTVGFLTIGGAGMPAQGADDAPPDTSRQIGKWYPSLEAGLNVTESAYSSNWSGGDKGSLVWTFLVNGTLENQLSPKANWLNTLKLAYGQTSRQVENTSGKRVWDVPEKSTDLIDLESLMRFTLGGVVDPFTSVRFESQFQDASDPEGRNLSLNPLRFKESVGAARQFVDTDDRSLLSRVGFSLRESARRQFVNPAPDLTTSTKTATDGGFEWVTDYKSKVLQDRVTWTSKLILYQALFYSGKSDLQDQSATALIAAGIDPDVAGFTTTLDVDWENIFVTQITKLISVNLYLRWVYDKYDNSVVPVLDDSGALADPEAVRTAIRKAGQFKQTLAVGFTYRFL